MFGGKTLKFDLKLHICYIQRNLEGYGCKSATGTCFHVASVQQIAPLQHVDIAMRCLGGPSGRRRGPSPSAHPRRSAGDAPNPLAAGRKRSDLVP